MREITFKLMEFCEKDIKEFVRKKYKPEDIWGKSVYEDRGYIKEPEPDNPLGLLRF